MNFLNDLDFVIEVFHSGKKKHAATLFRTAVVRGSALQGDKIFAFSTETSVLTTAYI